MADRFRDLVASARDLIAAVDRSGSLTYVSPAIQPILGFLPTEVVGHVLWELVHPDDVAGVHDAIGQLFERGERRSIEFGMLDAGGRWRRLDASMRLIESDGPLEGVLTATDVTERRETEAALRERDEELRQARKMEVVGRLASGISHDFGNLLTVIIGASAQVLDGLPPDSPLRGHVESIQGSAERAASMVRHLLGFGRRRPDLQTLVDLNALVGRAELLLRRLLGEHIELRTSCATDVWLVSADPIELEQVLLNLAVNARDAMSSGGLLLIETRNGEGASAGGAQPDMVSLSVSDTGIGMDADTQARVFEPFFTTKGDGKGTGLGLATVHAVVTEIGGCVEIVSASGRGTTITVKLPRAVGVPASTSPPPDLPVPVTAGTETVLLVEDEDGVRELVRDMLEVAGYKVRAAATPSRAEAIGNALEEPLDLLVTDVVMPEMSGLELSNRLKARRPGLRVMYMSGFSEPSVVGGNASAPGVNFISKPFDRKALLQCVRRALDTPGVS